MKPRELKGHKVPAASTASRQVVVIHLFWKVWK